MGKHAAKTGGRLTRRRRRRGKPGAPPGSLSIDPESLNTQVRVVSYDAESFEEAAAAGPMELAALAGRRRCTWVEVIGLGEEATLRALAERFQLHRLALEDVVNTHQRPKAEFYDDHVFLVARLVDAPSFLETEQVSFFLGRDYLLVFHDKPGTTFETVRQRIMTSAGMVRRNGPDYLAYALLDALMDEYFTVLEGDTEKLEKMEAQVFLNAGHVNLHDLHSMKNHLRSLRRAASPMQKAIEALITGGGDFVAPETRPYLRDALDHATSIVEQTDLNMDLARDLSNLHAAFTDNRMNEVMKVLTVFAAIFIPLNFIAAVYGMNFDPGASPWNMPELAWHYGYPFAIALMATVGLGLLLYFTRMKWIFSGGHDTPANPPAAPAAPPPTSGPGASGAGPTEGSKA